ncbi:MAG TPA: PaaI family thioesterase [Candidatus Thermoplasmatota archaeon]|jgi:uncharacterized protein (TIGR00369 family)|nr:PaaI family thioesterase [Candidatus Thermoplasmatota archaeon]
MARPDAVPPFAAANPEAAEEAIAHCFGCGPKNARGLHLEAKVEGDRATIAWQPSQAHAGWDTVIHGGLVATLIDEAAAFAIVEGLRSFGFTRTLQVQYRKPTRWTLPVRAEARVTERDAQRAVAHVRVTQEGVLTAEGTVEFRLMAEPPPAA